MKKLLLVSLCFLMAFMTQVYAQNRTVTGTVTSREDGLPIPGVTVKVKGSVIGTQTSVSGKFSLSVPPNSTLVFTYLGYLPVERAVSGPGAIDVQMEANNKQLGEVVVTGTLGRKLEEKATGYAQTHLSGTEVNESSETNLLTGLTGKVAGLEISTTGSGVAAGISVNLRGNRSIAGNNQALIVVDGVPLPNGDISAIDPNIIESYDILNGGSAGVLYGSEASNGVIVITTKKGSASGKPTVQLSSSLQASVAAYYPQIQNQYGMYGGESLGQGYVDPLTGHSLYVPYENELYGPQFNGMTVKVGAPAGSATGPQLTAIYSAQPKNAVQQFYNTGVTATNNVSVSSGNADDYFFLSAQDAIIHGIVPLDANTRYNAVMKAGKRYGIFKAEYSVSYTNAQITQDAESSYTDVMQFPANMNITNFKDPKSTFGNPSDYYDAYAGNPYWAVYNHRSNTTENILLANINLTLSPTKYLDINYKLSDSFGVEENHQFLAEIDYTPYSYGDPLNAGSTQSSFASAGGRSAGTSSDSYQTGDGSGGGYSRLQSDFIVNFHPTLSKDFKTNILLGTTFWDQNQKNMATSSNNLLIANFYNISTQAGTPGASESTDVINQVSYYGDATIGYHDYAFIDASIRHESDSRLAPAHQNYWYPGISGSFVFTDAIPALKGNKILSFGKIRAAYSITGQVSAGVYNINNTFSVSNGIGFPFGSLGGLALGSTNYTTLVPEKVTEIEYGAELGFLDNLIHGSFTYYKQNDRNQTLRLTTSPSTGFSSVVTNVGELQSSGFEAGLTISPLTKAKNKVGLDIGGTLTNTESKVISILPNAPQFALSTSPQFAIVGLPYPYLRANDILRDNAGQVVVSPTTGLPLLNPSLVNLGRLTPEWMLGLHADVSYKFISLNVVAEYRTGYVDYFSNANTEVFAGSSAFTTQNGRESFIFPNSAYQAVAGGPFIANKTVAIADGNYGFWTGSNFSNIEAATVGPLVSSAAFWKIREANLGFNLTQFIKNTKYIKGLKFSLTGRNLLMWVPKTNYWGDPELGGGQPTAANVPSQRVFGGKLDVTF